MPQRQHRWSETVGETLRNPADTFAASLDIPQGLILGLRFQRQEVNRSEYNDTFDLPQGILFWLQFLCIFVFHQRTELFLPARFFFRCTRIAWGSGRQYLQHFPESWWYQAPESDWILYSCSPRTPDSVEWYRSYRPVWHHTRAKLFYHLEASFECLFRLSFSACATSENTFSNHIICLFWHFYNRISVIFWRFPTKEMKGCSDPK